MAMPLTADSVIQQGSGSFVGTSGTASLPFATTAGNTLIIVASATASAITTTGFTQITNSGVTAVTGRMAWKNTAGGESSWTVGVATSQVCTWVVYEIEGLDQSNPVDVVATSHQIGTGTTLTTTTTPMVSTYDGMVIAYHACEDLTSPVPKTWSAHTDGLSELSEVGGNNGTISLGLSVSVAYTYTAAPKTWACTATKTAAAGQAALAIIAVLTSATAKYAADIAALTGFEFGPVAGIATGGATLSAKIFDAVTGSPTITTSTPRNGTYCLEVSASAAAENLLWGRAGGEVFNAAATTQLPLRLSIYFPSALPGADLVLFSLEPTTAADNVVVRYESSDSKIGVKVGTGTEVFSDAAVTANQWISIDMRMDGRTTTHVCDWQVDYLDDQTPVAQTAATATGVVVSNGWSVRLGWTASSTGTVRYDDVVCGRLGGHYPLGNMAVLPIVVDPAGTLTVSGSTANFNTFTLNGGAGAAWNAITARNAIDEVPPTIGASADGLAQVTTATSDYVEIPMTSVIAVDYGAAIRGVRMLACGWAISTTTATLGFRAYDGTTELTLHLAGDVQFDNSTTDPAWMCKLVRASATTRYDWTQTKLDALTFRVGFSSDADPDIGIHSIMGEVCLRIGDLVRVINAEDQFFVDFRIDPDSSGVLAVIITVPPGTRGVFYDYSLSGTPQTQVRVDPDPVNPVVHTVTIGATDITLFTEQTLSPDPE